MIGRGLAILLFALLAAATVVAVIAVAAADQPKRVVGRGLIRFDGFGPEWWARQWRLEHARRVAAARRAQLLRLELRRQRRALLADPSVEEAINLACATYGSCETLWRRARCETGGTFSPRALNDSSGAAGLFQFLDSTWRSTPYGRFSVWSAYANALAAGWMNTHGRGGEWACR